jgi:hypothetical protein
MRMASASLNFHVEEGTVSFLPNLAHSVTLAIQMLLTYTSQKFSL